MYCASGERKYVVHMSKRLSLYEECAVFRKIEKGDLKLSADLEGHQFTTQETRKECTDGVIIFQNIDTIDSCLDRGGYFNSKEYAVDALNEPLKTCADLVENALKDFFLENS